ncbi:MAG: hypothetical protein HY236_17530, partial [Acidobacteria bacterium]|nr:hypothetical protein [Acidobacteriota bacterium]
DQTRLPLEQVTMELGHYQQVVDAIREMRVRGAPAIGVAAAYAVAMAAREIPGTDRKESRSRLEKAAGAIAAARPTAVNLQWAVRRMLDKQFRGFYIGIDRGDLGQTLGPPL